MSYDYIYRRKRQRRQTRVRRQQEVQRQLFIIGVVIILVIVSIAYCSKRGEDVKEVKETAQVAEKQAAGGDSGEKTEKKKEESEKEETAQERLARVEKQAKEAGYPDEIIELLSKNPETVGFVEDYGAKKDMPAADTVGEVQAGQIPLLIQWDERWGYAPYGTSTVAASGCGPTCMSMVLTGLTGDGSITPVKVAAYGMERGFINEENDTYWQLMEEASGNWGISCSEINLEESTVATELGAGHPIICSVGPGDFTNNGHFIVLVGYADGNLTVYDPFNKANSEKVWPYTQIAAQTNAMWAYY